MRVVASIEARMGATRLPGKVMMDIAGMPAIGWMTRRVGRASRLDDLVIATTTNPNDDVIATWASSQGIACYRGSEDDVLGRVVSAQRFMNADVVVELCGDCPLMDPAVIDMGVERFLSVGADVVTTARQPSFPQGVDVEIFTLSALEKVEETVDDRDVREHVSLEFYRRTDRYRIVDLIAPVAMRRPDVRLLLDYCEDLVFLDTLCRGLLERTAPEFDTHCILAFLDENPSLMEINAMRSEAVES